MSDLLIKNLALPAENAQLHISILSDGTVVENFQNIEGEWVTFKMDGVKAVALPSHGRLIDADVLEDEAYIFKGVDGRIRTIVELCDIEDAPIVIEASGEMHEKDS